MQATSQAIVTSSSHTQFPAQLDARSPIAVVAAGRLGSSLALALAAAGSPLVAVSSRRPEHRAWLDGELRRTAAESRASGGDRDCRVKVCSEAHVAAEHATVVFVTSSDSAIAEVARSCKLRPFQYVVHCSGLLGADVLSEAAPDAIAGAMHPLQTFPSPDARRLFSGITFAVESPDPGFAGWLEELAAVFNGQTIRISGSRQRAAYHAAAVMSCGLLAGLAGVASQLWSELGVSQDEAIGHMSPMIESTARAISEMGMPDAMSGPFVRGDVETVRAHLGATRRVGEDVSRAYAALALAQLPLAQRKGGIDDATVAELELILSRHLDAL